MRLWLSIALALALCPLARAAVAVVAADTTWQAYSNALVAASAGDLVVIPKGSNDWGSVEVLNSKRVMVSGLGMSNTIIRGTSGRRLRTTAFSSGTNTYGYANLCVSGGTSASFGLLAIGSSTAYPPTLSNYNFRVHHVLVDGITNRGLYILGKSQGLIDHCILKAYNNIVAQGIGFQGVTRNGLLTNCDQVCLTYTNTLRFGTNLDFVYTEDCIWDWLGDGDGALDHYNDNNSVIRFNLFTNCNYMASHESAYNSSFMALEFYGNKAFGTSGVGFDAISHLRAGGSVIGCSNELTTTGYTMSLPGPRLTFYRSSGTNVFTCISTNCPGGAPDCPGGSYYPCGSVTGTNRLDGNVNLVPNEYGWPALYQAGWGDPKTSTSTNISQTFYGCFFKDNLYSGTNVAVVVDNFGGGGNPDNTGLTGAAGAGVWIPNSADLIQEGREYWNQTLKTNWTPYPYPHELNTSVTVSPASTNAVTSQSITFAGVGGSGAYLYWFLDANNSGGSINSTNGAYTSGTTSGVTDTIGMLDSWGNLAYATVSVTAASSARPFPLRRKL